LTKSKLLDIRLSFENTLYSQTEDDITKQEVEQIRNMINDIIDKFIKENDIKI